MTPEARPKSTTITTASSSVHQRTKPRLSMPNILSFRLFPAILANLIAAFSVLYSSSNYLTTQLRSCRRLATTWPTEPAMPAPTYKRGEVYFLSHGGPPSMFDTRSEPYQAWRAFGRNVEASKPRGLVVVSAHWEQPSGSSGVQVNNDLTNPLIYDFKGFPKHYYRETFSSHGDPRMLEDVVEALHASHVEVEQVARGADHGLWVPLKVAFNGKTNIPLTQVSLPGNSSPESTVKLGKALSRLRARGYTIVGSGQIVHNLRDALSGAPTPYAEPFLADVNKALLSPTALKSTLNLFRHHALYKKAHPTPEHLLPLLVPVAAADEGDRIEEMYVGLDKMGLGWGMWRWVPQEQ